MKKLQLVKVIFIFFIVCFSEFAFSQTTESLLSKAYKHNSSIILDEFFYRWQREFATISYNELVNQSDTIKEVYDLYYTFQELFEKNQLSSFNVDYVNKEVGNTKFLVLQESLTFEIEESNNFYKESEERIWTHDTILKRTKFNIPVFRATSKLRGHECLYLTQSYLELFQSFFANNFTKIYAPSYDSVYTDYQNKIKFLSAYVLIQQKGNVPLPVVYPGELLTDPRIESIVIYQDLQQAKVYFSIGCGYCVALFEKVDDKWGIKSCRELMVC